MPTPHTPTRTPATATPTAPRQPAARSYSTDRVCFGLSAHLYRGFLAAKGPAHRQTLRYRRQALRDAGFVISAGL